MFCNLPSADAAGYTLFEQQPAGYLDREDYVGVLAGRLQEVSARTTLCRAFDCRTICRLALPTTAQAICFQSIRFSPTLRAESSQSRAGRSTRPTMG